MYPPAIISRFGEVGKPNSGDANDYGGVFARPFPLRNNGTVPLPCFPPDILWRQPAVHRTPATEGFFLVKEMKTGGSTAAGIHLRIARNIARRRETDYPLCKVRNDHATARQMEYHRRDHSNSFLWTVLRDPTSRAVSQFFHFQVSRKGILPSDQNFINWIRKDQYLFRYYLRTLSVDPAMDALQDEIDPIEIANAILDDYNFIGITERMDETAVALQLLLGLRTGDILYTNAKISGGFDDGADPQKGCVYIVPSNVSLGMRELFNTPYWLYLTEVDTLLYRASNRSLDLTIDGLGRERFQKELANFRYAMSQVKERCLPTTKFPCTAHGERVESPDCFWMDSACGMDCLDKLADELKL